MKVNLGTGAQNSHDWDRVLAGNFSSAPETPDWQCVEGALALGDLAEPLGFDGIWFPEHCGTPYGMTPNPIQALTYFAGRTERVSLGTFVAVAPWWNPVRLAHQIAYLDIVSKGRYNTIGIGRGVSKSEFDAVGVPREESRERFNECLDILELAFSGERFSYDGEIFSFPEMSLRPEPYSKDLFSRIYSSSSTAESLEILSRRGMVPLFVGNKPIWDAGAEVQKVNTFRKEEGFAPCQPKNVMFMYCTPDEPDAASRPTSGSGRPTATSPCTTASPTRRTSRASRDMRPTPPARPPRRRCSPRPCRTSRSPAPRRCPATTRPTC